MRETSDSGKPVTFEEFQKQFGETVAAVDEILALMSPWRSPQYLTRAWCKPYTASASFSDWCGRCIFEFGTAVLNGKLVSLIIPPEEHADYLRALGIKGGGSRLVRSRQFDQSDCLLKCAGVCEQGRLQNRVHELPELFSAMKIQVISSDFCELRSGCDLRVLRQRVLQNANASVKEDKSNILKVLAKGDVNYETSENIASLNKAVREKVAEWYTEVAVTAARRRIDRKGGMQLQLWFSWRVRLPGVARSQRYEITSSCVRGS